MKLLRRGLYGPPPPGPQTQLEDHATLLWSWFCTIMAFVTIILRVFGRLSRNGQLFGEDRVMLLSIIPLMARMAFIHVVMIWGTNNIDLSVGLSPEDIQHRIIGSKLVLGARIFYALFIWTAKFTVSEFLKRLTYSYWKRSYQLYLHIIRIFLCVSFIAVVIATLAECQPVTHYWQVVPDPGPTCRQSYAQLITMATADVITDVLLIVFPLTILIPSGMPLVRRFKLGALFSISSVLIAITIVRVVAVVHHNGKQQRRTVYASGEILAAAAVSNAVVIGSFLRDRGVKKAKWRGSGMSDSINNASTTGTTVDPESRRQTLGNIVGAGQSDEDLFRDMCYRSTHDDADREKIIPRPAQAISHTELERHDSRAASIPHNSSRSSSVARGRPKLKKKASSSSGKNAIAPVRLSKTVTFSDPGGLLDTASSNASTTIDMIEVAGPSRLPIFNDSSPVESTGRSRTDQASENTRAGSMAELQDVGGLLYHERRPEEDDMINEI